MIARFDDRYAVANFSVRSSEKNQRKVIIIIIILIIIINRFVQRRKVVTSEALEKYRCFVDT